jgi:hypothetical protein
MAIDAKNNMTEVPETRRMNPDIIVSREQIRNYIEANDFRNRVRADNSGTVCGDGRVKPEQSKGYTRMLGGDEGLAMAIRGALNAHKPRIKISPAELIARLGASLREIRGDVPLSMHSDEHAEHDGGIGCGHVGKAVLGKAKHKSLAPEEVEELHRHVIGGKHKKLVLEGEHKEQAVLLVYGRDWTVNSFDEELDQMYFVVDMDRSMDLIEQVVPGLGIEGLTVEGVKEQFVCQMNETTKVLAGGEDIFRVNFHPSGDFELIHQGVVPQPESK